MRHQNTYSKGPGSSGSGRQANHGRGGPDWTKTEFLNKIGLSNLMSHMNTNQYRTVSKALAALVVLLSLTLGASAATQINWSNPADITYGTALGDTQLNATATDAGATVAGAFTYNPPSGTFLNAGTGQTLSVTFKADDGGATTNDSVSINVGKATLTAQAVLQDNNDDTSSQLAYRSDVPTDPGVANGFHLDVLLSGFVRGESETSLAGTPPVAGIDPANSFSGGAGANPSPAFAVFKVEVQTDPIYANYTFVEVKSNITVSKRAASIVVKDATRFYGEPNPTFTDVNDSAGGANFAPSGFLGSDAVTVGFSSSAKDLNNRVNSDPKGGSNAGAYFINADIVDPNNVLFNYDVGVENGTLTINKLNLFITADFKTKVFGADLPSFTQTFSAGADNTFGGNEGFFTGEDKDDLAGPVSIDTDGATTRSNVGTKTLTPSNPGATNYSITTQTGNLLTTTAAVTVTPDFKTKTFLSANPTYTFTATGLVSPDSASDFDPQPTIEAQLAGGLPVATDTPVGSYDLVVANGGAVTLDGNYTVTIATRGTNDAVRLDITALTPVVSWDANDAILYGTPLVTATAPADGTHLDAAITDPLGNAGTLFGVGNGVSISYANSDGQVISADTDGDGIFDVNGAGLDQIGAGNQEITLTVTPLGGATNDYGSVVTRQTIVVNKRSLRLKAGDNTKIFNDALPTVAADRQNPAATDLRLVLVDGMYGHKATGDAGNNEGYVYGDTDATVFGGNLDLLAEVNFSVDATSNSPVIEAGYTITPSIGSNDLPSNYNIVSVDGKLTITKRNPTITWGGLAAFGDVTYGHELSGTELNATEANGLAGSFGYDPASGTRLAKGDAQIIKTTFTPTDTQNWNTVNATRVIDVNRRDLVIAPNDSTATYGDTAAFDLTGADLDSVGVSDGITVAYETSAAPAILDNDANTNGNQSVRGSDVGAYTVTSTLTDPNNKLSNYNVSVGIAQLTISKRDLVMTLQDRSKGFGTATDNNDPAIDIGVGLGNADADVFNSKIVAYDNLAPGDDTAPEIFSQNPYISHSVVADTPVDESSAITVVVDAGSGKPALASNNYNITSIVDGTFTVGQANATIVWANPADLEYGKSIGGDQLNAVAQDVGGTNFDPQGTFTYTIDATGGAASGTVLNSGANQNLKVVWTPSASAGNYQSTTKKVEIDIPKRPLQILIKDDSKEYGENNPILEATYGITDNNGNQPVNGLVNGDTESSLDRQLVLATTAVSGSDAGDFEIFIAQTPTDANYTITMTGSITNAAAGVVPNDPFNDGDGATTERAVPKSILTVTARPLTILADDKVKEFGTALPELTATAVGLRTELGDTLAGLDTPLVLEAPGFNDVNTAKGTYTAVIIATGASDNNYTVTHVNGDLEVTGAIPVVDWDSPAPITYGAGLGADQLNASSATTAGTFTYDPAADTVLAAGTHTLMTTFTPDDAENFSSANGETTLTVIQAPLTVGADNASREYGDADSDFTTTLTGFVNGDTADTAFSTAPTIASSGSADSNVGDYALVASGGVSDNYTLSYSDGVLTVTLAPLTASGTGTKVYGAANPEIEATYDGFKLGDTVAVLTSTPTITFSPANLNVDLNGSAEVPGV